MHAIETYDRTQRGPWGVLMSVVAVFALWNAATGRGPIWIPVLLTVVGLFVLGCALSLQWLRIRDEGDCLSVAFGPLPLVQCEIDYRSMKNVEVGGTTLLDGWGIHYTSGGWLWNIWGFQCVVFQLEDRQFRVGSDDAENLAAFCRSRIEQHRGVH